ncbi:hypothetical protein HDU96_010029 [Phlyctochytrium bullatum]|nr:hypothetical protein HDU96_010029 [Phlyctochytrium bullatum]
MSALIDFWKRSRPANTLNVDVQLLAKCVSYTGSADVVLAFAEQWFPQDNGAERRHMVSALGKRACRFGPVEVVRWALENGTVADDLIVVAVLWGHVSIVQLLVKRGANLKTLGKNRIPLLHLAVDNGHTAVARLLLAHGANVAAPYKFGPLHLATRHDLALVQLLLDHGDNPNRLDCVGRTALHAAAKYDRADVARLLIQHGADVGVHDETEKTPLHTAARLRHDDVARLLLEHAAEVDPRDRFEWTPLHWASAHGNAGVAKLLLENGAIVGSRTDVETCGQTPLHLASEDANRKCGVDILQVLVDHGADVAATNTREARTPLHEAAANSRLMVVDFLLKNGADINSVDAYGRTALHLVSKTDDPTPVHLPGRANHGGDSLITALFLLSRDADPSRPDQKGWTPLHHAAHAGNTSIIHLLVRGSRANVNACDRSGWTPLHLAAGLGHKAAVLALIISGGADVNARNSDGSTPLHVAARRRWSEIAKTLIVFDAEVGFRDNYGNTPLHVVRDVGCARVLLEYGADAGSRNDYGSTPLEVANDKGLTEVAEVLREWRRGHSRRRR